MVEVRECRLEDMGGVCNIEKRCFRFPYPCEVLVILRTLYPELFLVAEDRGRVVGYVSAVIRRDGTGHVVSICVDPDYRGRGIGKALMNEILKKLRESGVCRVRLEVRVSNEVARRLYERLGFKVVDRIDNYYPDGEDALVMVKDLCGEESKQCRGVDTAVGEVR